MNEKNRLTKCSHCGSENIEETGWDIQDTDDNDVISILQYRCDDCGKISSAPNSLKAGEFELDLSSFLLAEILENENGKV